MIKASPTFLDIIIHKRFVLDFWGNRSKDFNQNLALIQKEFVSLHIDNMFVEPASESPLTASDRAVYLAKNS